MSGGAEFAGHVVDLLAVFAPCEAKRMFGGHGIFRDGLMFGLIADGELYLKADDENRARFEAEGSEAFIYTKQGKPFRLSYYRAPAEFFDDAEARARWARLAHDAALRNPSKKRRKK